ncbi:MAG TPA: RNA methyltransferase [Vicinamibacterales bacterium]|nr:RNA methyltransferase [Vicinamibacterales bacterium]
MQVVRLSGLDDPCFLDRGLYRDIADHKRLRSSGLFVAEGRLVVQRLIVERFSIRSLLLNDAALRALESDCASLDDHVVAYICDTAAFEGLTGYDIHRGCLALAPRPAPRSILDVSVDARSLILLEEVANADNVGGIFRNAAAFGADGVILSHGCADPLYRKTIRTSMAAALLVPFAVAEDDEAWREALVLLRACGFRTVALTPTSEAADLEACASSVRSGRLALLVGAEGRGLTASSQAAADVCVRIPIRENVDSLNVAVATGIALYRLLGPAG